MKLNTYVWYDYQPFYLRIKKIQILKSIFFFLRYILWYIFSTLFTHVSPLNTCLMLMRLCEIIHPVSVPGKYEILSGENVFLNPFLYSLHYDMIKKK